MSTQTLYAGGRGIAAEVVKEGRRLWVTARRGPLTAELRAMKGAKWHPERKAWAVSDCPRNALQFALLRGELPEEIARYDRPLARVEPIRKCLRPHQRDMLDFLLGRKRCVLAAEMRTGKTLTVIEGMDAVGGSWIYCAPAGVLAAIELELEKWDASTRPLLVSHAKLADTLAEWEGPAPAGFVFDESSRLKNPTAVKTKAAQHLANAIREEHDGYVWLLTGTPEPKEPPDWWAPAEIACPGFLRESSRAKLEQRMAVYVQRDDFREVVGWKEREQENLAQRLVGLVHVVLFADVFPNVPPIRHELIECPPPEDMKRAARLVANTSATAVETLNRLRQLSDGFAYAEDGNATRGPTPKDDALQRLLVNAECVAYRLDPAHSGGRCLMCWRAEADHVRRPRVVIYTGFRDSCDRVVELCRDEGWQVVRRDGRGWLNTLGVSDADALREFDRELASDPRPIAFVGNPGSGGMGLTLSAASWVAYYSQDFNGESRMQSEVRAVSSGRTVGPLVYDLCCLPTDRLVLRNLRGKKKRQKFTMEEIQGALA